MRHFPHPSPFYDKDGNQITNISGFKVGDTVYRRYHGKLIECEVTGLRPVTTRSSSELLKPAFMRK